MGFGGAATALPIQGETHADSGSTIDSTTGARIASLARDHFSPEHAALIKANLQIRDYQTVAHTLITAMLAEEEVAQSPAASTLEQIAEYLTIIHRSGMGKSQVGGARRTIIELQAAPSSAQVDDQSKCTQPPRPHGHQD